MHSGFLTGRGQAEGSQAPPSQEGVPSTHCTSAVLPGETLHTFCPPERGGERL